MIIPARPRIAGFTLIEILVVMAVFAVAISLSTPSLIGTKAKAELTTDTDVLSSSLEYARQQSIGARGGYAYQVHLDPAAKNYTILPDNKTYSLKPGVTMQEPSVPVTITFNKLTGIPDNPLLIKLSSRGFYSLITINTGGTISVSSPIKE